MFNLFSDSLKEIFVNLHLLRSYGCHMVVTWLSHAFEKGLWELSFKNQTKTRQLAKMTIALEMQKNRSELECNQDLKCNIIELYQNIVKWNHIQHFLKQRPYGVNTMGVPNFTALVRFGLLVWLKIHKNEKLHFDFSQILILMWLQCATVCYSYNEQQW